MSREHIEALLRSQGYGIISLCREGTPYSIPISFGYDGEHVYFGLLEDSPEPTKLAYIEDGATARFLVTDIRGRFDWQSVALTGSVRSLDRGKDEWERCMDALEDNAWFMRSFERSDSVESLQAWELRVDDLQGLEQKEEVYD